jgi:MFS family permease
VTQTVGDVRRVFAGRGIRALVDGLVSVVLAQYLTELGFSPFRIGAIVTGTLVGSAALTLGVGLAGGRRSPRRLLLAASALMIATGFGFALVTPFWGILAVAVVGTLNPTSGDVSVFLPTEQALVATQVGAADRPRTYAVYNFVGAVAGAVGALLSAVPEPLHDAIGWSLEASQRLSFGLYAVAGVAILVLYRGLDESPPLEAPATTRVLESSRRTVLELSALFSLDSAGSGFVGTSLLVLWLHLRFDLSAGATGALFFVAGLLGGASQLLAARLAPRLGLIRTMVFTHIPANLLLALAAFAPNGPVAIVLLLGRALFSQMDVPARQAFVMAVVPPDERSAAASVTNVPRSLASAATPLLAGAMLSGSTFGWPLIVAGASKTLYDVLLLAMYRSVPEEEGASRRR